MKKVGFMKDALILFAITLVSGILLGGVYQITKQPIADAKHAANLASYRAVFSDAVDFKTDDGLVAAVSSCNEQLVTEDYGKVGIDSALHAIGADGSSLGYVVVAYSDDSYGGRVKLSVGVKADGTITGVQFLEISDTPGLGLKAKEPAFIGQYPGKSAESLTVTKSGSANDAEINAISGATVTSNATTNAVNAALYYVHNCVNK